MRRAAVVGAGLLTTAASGGSAPPLCPCHGKPMLARRDRPGWRCKVKQRAYDNNYQRARYRRHVAAGICGNCGQELAAVGVRCFDCAVQTLEREAIRQR